MNFEFENGYIYDTKKQVYTDKNGNVYTIDEKNHFDHDIIGKVNKEDLHPYLKLCNAYDAIYQGAQDCPTEVYDYISQTIRDIKSYAIERYVPFDFEQSKERLMHSGPDILSKSTNILDKEAERIDKKLQEMKAEMVKIDNFLRVTNMASKMVKTVLMDNDIPRELFEDYIGNKIEKISQDTKIKNLDELGIKDKNREELTKIVTGLTAKGDISVNIRNLYNKIDFNNFSKLNDLRTNKILEERHRQLKLDYDRLFYYSRDIEKIYFENKDKLITRNKLHTEYINTWHSLSAFAKLKHFFRGTGLKAADKKFQSNLPNEALDNFMTYGNSKNKEMEGIRSL